MRMTVKGSVTGRRIEMAAGGGSVTVTELPQALLLFVGVWSCLCLRPACKASSLAITAAGNAVSGGTQPDVMLTALHDHSIL